MEQRPKKCEFKPWTRLSISSLEADLAYFDARLALLNDEIESCYQDAQIRAYKELEKILLERLTLLRGKSMDDNFKGIEVREEFG